MYVLISKIHLWELKNKNIDHKIKCSVASKVYN